MIDSDFKKCSRLLKTNGWNYTNNEEFMFGLYTQDELVSVALQNDEILILGDESVIELPMNYYALVGALFELRQIAVNYASA